MHVGEDGAAGEAADEDPERDRDGVDVHGVRARAAHEAETRGQAADGLADEGREAARAQHALAEHGRGGAVHGRADARERGDERAVGRQGHDGAGAGGHEARDALEQHAVGSVQLGARVRDEDRAAAEVRALVVGPGDRLLRAGERGHAVTRAEPADDAAASARRASSAPMSRNHLTDARARCPALASIMSA